MNVETARKVVEIFDDIKQVSSRTGKEALLRVNKDFPEFVRVLTFLYNPYILTGIAGKKLLKFANFTSDKVKQFNGLDEAIDYIVKNNSGRDEDVQAIANFINTFDPYIGSPVHDFLQDLFTKSYKCGITASTINKVFGKNFIPKFEVQLAKKFEDEQHKITGNFGVSLKLDGIRCVAINDEDGVTFFTRQGIPIEGLIELERCFRDLPKGMVYDGELLLRNPLNLPSDELFRLTQKRVRKDGTKKDVRFIMFDMLPKEEFLEGKSKKTWEERTSEMNRMLNYYDDGQFDLLIETVPVYYVGNDKTIIFKLLDAVISQGYEGLMVNNAKGFYVTKRTDNLLKVKKMHTVDLKIIDVEEGTGKNVGKLGALVVDYKGFRCGVGSGFTDVQREQFWAERDDLIGKIVEIQYFEESTNQDGGVSLRFPVFKQIRDDKDEVSYY